MNGRQVFLDHGLCPVEQSGGHIQVDLLQQGRHGPPYIQLRAARLISCPLPAGQLTGIGDQILAGLQPLSLHLLLGMLCLPFQLPLL